MQTKKCSQSSDVFPVSYSGRLDCEEQRKAACCVRVGARERLEQTVFPVA